MGPSGAAEEMPVGGVPMFDGAAGFAQERLMMNECSFCLRGFPHPSLIAYVVNDPPYPFALVKDYTEERIKAGVPLSVFDSTDVRP